METLSIRIPESVWVKFKTASVRSSMSATFTEIVRASKGKVLSRTKSKPTSLNLPPDVVATLNELAAANNLKLNTVVTMLLEDHFDSRNSEPAPHEK